jgi:hypothetical protein
MLTRYWDIKKGRSGWKEIKGKIFGKGDEFEDTPINFYETETSQD